MSNFIVDFKSKQLTLLDSRFYTTEDGGHVPSVTTILEAYPKDYGYFQWLKTVGEDADTIRDEAGRRGSVVHDLTERYDAGEEISLLNENGNLQLKLNEWSMFEKFVDFTTRYQPKVLINEQNYVSEGLGFAGTLDRVIELDGKKILIDIKTSNAIYPSYWLQLAAYHMLMVDQGAIGSAWNIDAVGILWLNAKTRTEGKKGAVQGLGWQLVMKDDWASDWELFKATKMLWTAQNKDVTPRKLSYQLSHKRQ